MSDALGLRERKKRRTRAALSRAAIDLCAERGVDAVTVADIAGAADVSARTFFNYFSSKEEAIVGGPERAERYVRLLAARPDDEPIAEALRGACAAAFADEAVEHRDLLRAIRLVEENPSLSQQALANWAEMERRTVAEVARRLGAAADDLLPRLIVATTVAAVRVAVERWITSPTDAPLADAIDEAVVAVAGGFADR